MPSGGAGVTSRCRIGISTSDVGYASLISNKGDLQGTESMMDVKNVAVNLLSDEGGGSGGGNGGSVGINILSAN